MKNTQKWMVVPFDSEYFKKFENNNQILKNKIIPADQKIQIFNDFLTKFLLKKNPEKQLPIDNIYANLSKDSELEKKENFRSVINELENKFLDISNSQEITQDMLKTESSPPININNNSDRNKPGLNDELMDFSDDNNIEVDKDEVEKARLKQKRPRRILDDSLNRTIGFKKKNRLEKETDYLEDAPYQNTRGEKKRNILNNAQIGKGWCIFK